MEVFTGLLKVHGTVQILGKILLYTFISHWITSFRQGATSKLTFHKHFFMFPQHVMFEQLKTILNTLQNPLNYILAKSLQLVRCLQFFTVILKLALKIMLLIKDWIPMLRTECLLKEVLLLKKERMHQLDFRRL